MEQAIGEPVGDPMLLLSVLNSSWAANWTAFDGNAMRALAAQYLAVAEKQSATFPRVHGHWQMGISLMATGDPAESLTHFDQAIALYDPAKHRALEAARGFDLSAMTLLGRAWTLSLLGYPKAALRDAESALSVAREIGQAEIGQAGTLMYTLGHYAIVQILCGSQAEAVARAQEQAAVAEETGAPFWKTFAMRNQGCALVRIGKPSNAIELLVTGGAQAMAMRSTLWLPFYFFHLARAHADLGQFEEARRCIDEALIAVETAKEKWCEADVHRTAGEIALMGPEPDAARAEAYFERALAVARAQQAKSFELRAATSMARLWRDQGKRDKARRLLVPAYDWFTEGFDTLDLKETKALLDALAS
jgi:predicted ATPase